MPRVKEYSRSEVLNRAMRVFHAKGFEGTSMEDLVKAMGINRFSIYSEFGSKEKLFHQAIVHYRKDFVQRSFEEILSPDSGWRAIRKYFEGLYDFLISANGWKGCLVTNSAVDFAWADAATRAQARDHFAFMEKAFRQCLERARQRKEIAQRHDPARLARLLVIATQGMGVLTKVRLTPDEWKTTMDSVLAVIETP